MGVGLGGEVGMACVVYWPFRFDIRLKGKENDNYTPYFFERQYFIGIVETIWFDISFNAYFDKMHQILHFPKKGIKTNYFFTLKKYLKTFLFYFFVRFSASKEIVFCGG